jgi:hypothetical protein
VLAFSAIRNSDKVGLMLYTDRVERYLPPKKGRRHVLRVVRDILYHEPAGPRHRHRQGARRRESRAASARHRVPDFRFRDARRSRSPPAPQLRRAMRQTNRRHDLDRRACRGSAREGTSQRRHLALEDAETGEIIELNTGSAAVRKRFKELRRAQPRLVSDFRSEGVDTCNCKPTRPTSRAAAILQNARPPARMNRPSLPRRAHPPASAALRAACACSAAAFTARSHVRAECRRRRRGHPRHSRAQGCPAGSWFWYAVAGALSWPARLCHLASCAWRRSRRRERVLTTSELALQRLEAKSALMQPQTAREFGIAASDIVREYIEKRFNVTATQRTTEEFLQTCCRARQ